MRSKFFRYSIQLLKFIVFIGALSTIYKAIATQKDLLNQLINFFKNGSGFTFSIICVLGIFNWAIEAKKWQLVVHKFEHISFSQAIKATLAGSTISLIMPKRMGEFLGRIVFINLNKVLATLLTLLASFSQTIITIAAGSVGFMLYLNEFEFNNSSSNLQTAAWVLAVVVGVLLIGFYFSVGPITSSIHPNNYSGKLKLFLKITRLLARVPPKIQAQLLGLSALRYTVFSTQYFLLLHLAGVHLTVIEGFTAISAIYLLLAVVPTIALSELGIREAVAISIISNYSSNSVGVVLASFSIWLINLAAPALLGAFFLLMEKLKLKGFTLFVQKPNL